jgi:hypothetical protein
VARPATGESNSRTVACAASRAGGGILALSRPRLPAADHRNWNPCLRPPPTTRPRARSWSASGATSPCADRCPRGACSTSTAICPSCWSIGARRTGQMRAPPGWYRERPPTCWPGPASGPRSRRWSPGSPRPARPPTAPSWCWRCGLPQTRRAIASPSSRPTVRRPRPWTASRRRSAACGACGPGSSCRSSGATGGTPPTSRRCCPCGRAGRPGCWCSASRSRRSTGTRRRATPSLPSSGSCSTTSPGRCDRVSTSSHACRRPVASGTRSRSARAPSPTLSGRWTASW